MKRRERSWWLSAAILCAALGVPAAPLAQEAATGDPEPEIPMLPEAVRAESRPAFVLPDIVVEGEDLSRLTGGMRLFDLQIPGVRPTQRPMLVAPEATGYHRRTQMSFLTTLPAPARQPWERGWVRMAAERGPGGSAAMVLQPTPERPRIFWADLSGWHDRLADHTRIEGGGGLLAISPAPQPELRLGLGVRASQHSWPAGSDREPDHRVRLIAADVDLERTLSGIVIGAGVAGGSGSQAWPESPDQKATRNNHWLTGSLRLLTRGTMHDLRARGGGIVCDLEGGMAHHRSPDDSSRTSPRGRGRIGWRAPTRGGRVALGVAAGGDRDAHVVGPWISYHRWVGSRRLEFSAILGPRTVYPEELLSGGGPRPSLVNDLIAADGGAWRDLPRVAWRQTPLPGLASSSTLLRPETEWPRAEVGFRLHRESGSLRARASAAKLRDPLSWRPAQIAGQSEAFATANLRDRWLARVEAAGRWSLGPRCTAGIAYAWTWDADASSGEVALRFQPAHEFAAVLDGQLTSFLWGAAVHARSEVAAGAERLDPFVLCRASVGWSFGSSRILLVGENLLDDQVRYAPGDGISGPWVRIVWERTFTHRVS